MKVLGIDPGYDRMGIAILERNEGVDTVLFSECIETDKKLDLSDRLLFVGERVEDLLKEHHPDAVAVETLFFNKNLKTAIAVAQSRGIAIYLAKKFDCILYEFGPQEIKIAATGYGKSDKSSVIAMIQRLVVNVPQKALDDEYDAIAVGITCLAHHRATVT